MDLTTALHKAGLAATAKEYSLEVIGTPRDTKRLASAGFDPKASGVFADLMGTPAFLDAKVTPYEEHQLGLRTVGLQATNADGQTITLGQQIIGPQEGSTIIGLPHADRGPAIRDRETGLLAEVSSLSDTQQTPSSLTFRDGEVKGVYFEKYSGPLPANGKIAHLAPTSVEFSREGTTVKFEGARDTSREISYRPDGTASGYSYSHGDGETHSGKLNEIGRPRYGAPENAFRDTVIAAPLKGFMDIVDKKTQGALENVLPQKPEAISMPIAGRSTTGAARSNEPAQELVR